MPDAKSSSSRPSPARLPWLAMLVAVTLGLGLSLLSADATAQTRATLTVPPEPAGNTILVLNYSNSMWGQIDGVAKIEIARDIIERNLVDWNQSTRLGLVAAPAAQAAVDPAATEAATQQPSLTGGYWSKMGLKDSISTSF